MHSLLQFFHRSILRFPQCRIALRRAAFLLCLAALPAFADGPKQSAEFIPTKTSEGLLFQYSAPGVTAVYLAGDFNSWANATDGKITGADARMDGPDTNGVWRKVLKLEPGPHAFKFNLEGAAEKWFVPDWATPDKDGNATLTVNASGDVEGLKPAEAAEVPVGELELSPQQKDGRVTFRYIALEANIVYLAGDFNNWADNQQGSVADGKYAMTKVGNDGLWQMEVVLNPGRHAYKFVIDGARWENDPHAIDKDADGNSIIDVN